MEKAPSFITAEDSAVMTDEKINRVALIAENQFSLEEQIEIQEEKLKILKTMHRQLCEKDLPNAMAELNAESFKTKNGLSISIKDELSASITAAKKDKAFKWLDDNGHAGIIKTKIEMAFSKGAQDLLDTARKALDDVSIGYKLGRSVHSGTLKSFCKEQIKNGAEIPLDLFGVYQYKRAKLKKEK